MTQAALRVYGESSTHAALSITQWGGGCCRGRTPRSLDALLALAARGLIDGAQLIWRTELFDPATTMAHPKVERA